MNTITLGSQVIESWCNS